MRRALYLLLVLTLLFGTLTSCAEKTVSHTHAEIVLNIPKKYKEIDPTEPIELKYASGKRRELVLASGEGTDMAFATDEAIVGVSRLSFVAALESGIPDTMTQKDFAIFNVNISGRECEVLMSGDVPYYSYVTRDAGGNGFYFLVTHYRTKHAYFTVYYVTAEDRADEYRDIFLSYAGAVSFTD